MATGSTPPPQNDGSTPQFFDADGRPLSTVVEPRNNAIVSNNEDDQQANAAVDFDGDERDGRECSPFTEDDDQVQEVPNPNAGTSEKAPAANQVIENPGQQLLTITAADFKTLVETIKEQNRRLESLKKHYRPPRHGADDPSRRQPAQKKRGRTPPREDRPAQTSKRGKGIVIRKPSPSRKTRPPGGNSATTSTDRGKKHVHPNPPPPLYNEERSPSPQGYNSPRHQPSSSDEDDNQGPLS